MNSQTFSQIFANEGKSTTMTNIYSIFNTLDPK